MGEEYISAEDYQQFLDWTKARIAEGKTEEECTYNDYQNELKIIFEK